MAWCPLGYLLILKPLNLKTLDPQPSIPRPVASSTNRRRSTPTSHLHGSDTDIRSQPRMRVTKHSQHTEQLLASSAVVIYPHSASAWSMQRPETSQSLSNFLGTPRASARSILSPLMRLEWCDTCSRTIKKPPMPLNRWPIHTL